MDHTNFNTEEIIRKPGKHLTSDERGKIEVMRKLGYFDAKFSDVFKTITSDNGPEFATLSKYEDTHHTKIYFAHPYCSCECPQNERYNGFIREYIPKVYLWRHIMMKISSISLTRLMLDQENG